MSQPSSSAFPIKNGSWTITDSQIAYQTPFVKVREDSVTLGDYEGVFSVVSFGSGNGSASCVLPVDLNTKKAYLGKEFRYALGREILGVCVGHVDEGETPEVAAKRELSEELGISANNFIHLGVCHQGLTNLQGEIHLYLATDLTFGKSDNENTESIEMFEFDFKKVVEMAYTDEMLWSTGNYCIVKADKYLRENGLI